MRNTNALFAIRGQTNRETDMSVTRQAALVALGAMLIALAVIGWKYLTEAMTLFAETFWCSTFEKTGVCRFRGYQHFLIWTVIGIINLLVMGLLIDRIGDRFRR
jgi:hypothetical protein